MTTLSDIDCLIGSLCAGTAVFYALAEICPPDDTLTLSQLAARHLAPIERGLMGALRSPKRRAEFCAGRIAAKLALSKSPFHRASSPAVIGRSASGAPVLLNECHDAFLSISHSGPFAVAVVARFPVGIDLERDEARPKAFSQMFLTQAERAMLDATAAHGQQTLVNHFWCRKEAACKVGGWGSTLPFGKLESSLPHTTIDQRVIHLGSCSAAGYVASLGREPRRTMETSHTLSLGSLIHG
jgi:phosphopantetheinyl transferase